MFDTNIRKSAAAVVTVASLALLTGCVVWPENEPEEKPTENLQIPFVGESGAILDSHPELIDSETEEPEEPEETYEPEIYPEILGISGSVDLKDRDGYTYTLHYDVPASEFVEDPTDAKPGFTDLLLPSAPYFAYENTTPSRTAPSEGLGVGAYGLYELDSNACTSEVAPTDSVSQGDRMWLGKGGKNAYCVVRLTGNSQTYGEEISAGGELQLQFLKTQDSVSQKVEGVPEEDAASLAESLNDPAAHVLISYFSGWDLLIDQTASVNYEGACDLDIVYADGGKDRKVTVIPVDGVNVCE